MQLNRDLYLKKVMGCWMGKNIGGTVGAPFEWKRQVNDIQFYTQELDGNPLPNDDLDIQLLWLIALEEKGVRLDAKTLGEYWLSYVSPHWAEYGNGKLNMRSGMVPPLSGSLNNDYKDSCGSFIRSEIWACCAPGNPLRAAQFAYQDSAIDHGNGEGTYAEILVAAIESAAFVENDLRKLIEIGTHYIPKDCGVYEAVELAMSCFDRGLTYLEARDEMLRQLRGLAPFDNPDLISAEDCEKGFYSGKRGWEVPANIGMLMIGLLYSENDFEKCMCITVNCGEDTDCTAATAGSIFGIINTIDNIPEKWIQPIGYSIKTLVLNLGEIGGQVAKDIHELTERTAKIAEQVIDTFHLPIRLSDEATDLSDSVSLGKILFPKEVPMYKCFGWPEYHFDLMDAYVDYGEDGPYLMDGEDKVVRLVLRNIDRISMNLSFRVLTEDGLDVKTSRFGHAFLSNRSLGMDEKMVEFVFAAETVKAPVVYGSIMFTVMGRHTVMTIPIVLFSGNYN